MENRKFRVALIGCGSIAPNHIQSLQTVENARLVALCDLKPEKCTACIEKFGLDAKIYTDYIEMYDKEKPDAVHIATPHYLHAEMTIAALERGINVFLEKPMCVSVDHDIISQSVDYGHFVLGQGDDAVASVVGETSLFGLDVGIFVFA